MVRFAKNHKLGHKTKMHWLQSDQKLLLRGQWYHFQKNACFRKFEILGYLVGDSAKAVFLENEESRYILFTYRAIESH